MQQGGIIIAILAAVEQPKVVGGRRGYTHKRFFDRKCIIHIEVNNILCYLVMTCVSGGSGVFKTKLLHA